MLDMVDFPRQGTVHERNLLISNNDGGYALSAAIMKILEYLMAATCLTKAQWSQVMKMVQETGLNFWWYTTGQPTFKSSA